MNWHSEGARGHGGNENRGQAPTLKRELGGATAPEGTVGTPARLPGTRGPNCPKCGFRNRPVFVKPWTCRTLPGCLGLCGQCGGCLYSCHVSAGSWRTVSRRSRAATAVREN